MIKAKLLEFVFKNWKELLVIVSLSLVAIKTRVDYNALNKAYEISQNELELQINSLKDIHASELARRDEALDTYRSTLEEIERNYLESQRDLERAREDRTREYVHQFSHDKEALANEITNTYSFEHVE